MSTTPWGDDTIYRPLSNAAATYYSGEMIALNSSGYAVKCDDTAGLKFDGLNTQPNPIQVFSGGSNGDLSILNERPWRFAMAIASAVLGDEGKALYAVDSQTVGYTTSNSILVGFVDQVLTATSVLVNPLYAPLNPVAVSNNTLAFSGSTGANQITMPDNLADALSVAEGSNEYLTFTTTNSGEKIQLKKNTTLAGTLVITSTSATAFEVGPNGATNPTFVVVGSVSSEAGGLQVTGQADNVGVYLDALGSNTNEPLAIAGKGSGVITIGGNATGTGSTGGAVVRIKTSTVAATGTVIGNAAAVGEGFVYVTGSNNTAGVQLPASVAGKQVTVLNTVAGSILLCYPPASSQINAKGVNNVYNIPNAGRRTFTCVSGSLWYTDPETIV